MKKNELVLIKNKYTKSQFQSFQKRKIQKKNLKLVHNKITF